jgi:hypothetical protein
MSLRVAVQEQNREPFATANEIDRGSFSFDLLPNELIKHGRSVSPPVCHKGESGS